MVRRLLVVYVLVLAGALLWSRVEAATVPATLPANVTFGGGAYAVNGSAASGAVSAVSTVALGGGAVASFPVMYRLGQLAGLAARTAIRANAVAAGAQTALWLLQYGIKKCDQYGWCVDSVPEQAPNGKPYPQADGYYRGNAGYGDKYASDPTSLCQTLIADSNAHGNNIVFASIGVLAGGIVPCNWTRPTGGSNPSGYMPMTKYSGCKTGDTLNASTGMCVPPGYVPSGTPVQASDTDWAKVPTTGIPDNVLTGVMVEGKQFLPATPETSTAVQTVPLSNVYKDPTTGTSYRDFAYVTPNDPQSANLQVVKTQVDPATGNPVTDPTTGNTSGTTKPEDPCTANPNRVGCMDKGDIPAAPDLLKSEKTITIAPDSGWGSDTAACPADIVVPMRTRGAQPAVFSYQPVCKAADMFRPVIIGMAWLFAVLIAIGVARRGE